jgi:NADPH2:quinone reductase
MLAIRQHTFGGPEELRFEELPDPQPSAGEVRIRVDSAGVHLLDTLVRRGVSGGPAPLPELPMTPGREVAGVVDEVGDGVDTAIVGQRVVADLGLASGGYAELALAPAGALHALGDGLASDAAVAMVGTGRTAMAILEVAAPTVDDVAVVTAAAGGVGTLLVQALRDAGAVVVGVAGGSEKLSVMRDLGAAAAIDYTLPRWTEAVRAAVGERAITLALDGVGGHVGRAVLELLGVGGRLVMFGSASGRLTDLTAADLYARGIAATSAIGARIIRRQGGVRPLETRALEAAAAGRLVPVIGQRFPLADAALAHRAIESRATTGKTVLCVH